MSAERGESEGGVVLLALVVMVLIVLITLWRTAPDPKPRNANECVQHGDEIEIGKHHSFCWLVDEDPNDQNDPTYTKVRIE